MRIPVSELRATTDRLLALLESEGPELVLSSDYYWHIDGAELHHVERNPCNLSIGQLSEDWENLRQMLQGETDPIRYQFVWLAALLRAAGEG